MKRFLIIAALFVGSMFGFASTADAHNGWGWHHGYGGGYGNYYRGYGNNGYYGGAYVYPRYYSSPGYYYGSPGYYYQAPGYYGYYNYPGVRLHYHW